MFAAFIDGRKRPSAEWQMTKVTSVKLAPNVNYAQNVWGDPVWSPRWAATQGCPYPIPMCQPRSYGNRLNHSSERKPAQSERIAARPVKPKVISCFSARMTSRVAKFS